MKTIKLNSVCEGKLNESGFSKAEMNTITDGVYFMQLIIE